MTRESQNRKILRYLGKSKKGITNVDAAAKFGCYRLSGRIFDLRQDGHNIVTVTEPNSNGIGTHARYFLVEGNKE